MSEPAIIAAVAGAVLLLASLGWRYRSRRRAASLVRTAMVDGDPSARRAAVLVAAERGLGPYVNLLLERTRQEQDETVLAAIADVVSRNQWEPLDDRRVVDLRRWAQGRLEDRIAAPAAASSPNGTAVHGRAADGAASGHAGDGVGGSVPMSQTECVEGVTAVATLERVTGDKEDLVDGYVFEELRHTEGAPGSVLCPGLEAAGVFDTGPQEASEDGGVVAGMASPVAREALRAPREAPTEQWSRRRSPSPTWPRAAVGVAARRQASPPAVLVTGAGGAAGVAVIRALSASGHRVIAADANGLAVGLRLASSAGLVPGYEDDNFVDQLLELAALSGAEVLISTVAEEMMALATANGELRRAGLAAWLPSAEAIETCVDKWRFAQLASDSGIPCPATNVGSADGVPGPWIVKPRFGRGSRDVYPVDRFDELTWALSRVSQPVVQTRLTGREFTVDALVDRDHRVAGAVPRWRLETKGGISTKGRTFVDEGLHAEVERLVAALRIEGPVNVQGFMPASGKAVLVEVNPRFSGGLPLSLAAGACLVDEYVRGILGEPLRPYRLAFQPGVTMLRHYEEIFE